MTTTSLKEEKEEPPKPLARIRSLQESQDKMLDEIVSTFEKYNFSESKNNIITTTNKISSADRNFEELKRRESSNEAPPPFTHWVITFEYKPGWRIDAYQFGIMGVQTYVVCRAFWPNNKGIYDTWEMRGLEFDEWLGAMDHQSAFMETSEYKQQVEASDRMPIEEKMKLYPEVPEEIVGRFHIINPPKYIDGCHCMNCDKEANDGLTIETLYRKKDTRTFEEVEAEYNSTRGRSLKI